MADKKNTSSYLMDSILFSDRVSYFQKSKNDFEWVKRKAEAFINFYPDNFGQDYLDRVEDNYRVLAGRAPKNYKDNKAKELQEMMQVRGETKKGTAPYSRGIDYYDTVSPIILSQLGDQQRRDFKLIATDSSSKTRNYIKDLTAKTVSQYFENKFIKPGEQQAMMQVAAQFGITDPYTLSPEEQQEFQAQVQQQMQNDTTLSELRKMLQTGPQGIYERQTQEFADYLAVVLDVKRITDQNYYHSYATGGQVYATDLHQNQPFFERVDLTQYYTFSSKQEMFVDKNPIHKRTMYLHPSEIWTRWGDEFDTPAKLKEFDNLINYQLGKSNANDSTSRSHDAEGGRLMGTISTTDIADMRSMDLRTKDGQLRYSNLLKKYVYNGKSTRHEFLKVVHLVFLTRRKMYYVLHRFPNGNVRWMWHDESYEFDRRKGDLKKHIYWAPVYWEVYAIGEEPEPIYIKPQRCRMQYRNPENPFEVHSPYIGAFYFKMNEDSYETIATPIDKSMQYVHDINVAFRHIKERQATDIGKAMLVALDAKPEGWSWGQFMAMVRALKVIPVDTKRTGMSDAALNMFKQVDLGNMFDIVQHINYIQFLTTKLVEVLLSTQARQGAVPASTSVTNNMQNMQRSYAMTSNMTVWHDWIVERLMERLMHLGKYAVKKGNGFLRYALSNQSIGSIDLDPEILQSIKEAVRISSDPQDIDMVELGKNILAPFMQTMADGNLRNALEIVTAKNMAELKHFATEADLQRELAVQSQREFEMQMQQESAEMARQMREFEMAFEEKMEHIRGEYNLANSEIRADVLKRGADVNADDRADFLEKGDKDRASRIHIEEMKRDLEKFRIEKEAELKEMEIKSREKISRNKSKGK